MIDWAGLAQRKYDIMQQGADADTSRAGSTRMQARTQASLAPSAIAGAEADAALTSARAAGMPALMTSEAALNSANAGLVGANTRTARIQNNALALLPDSDLVEALFINAGRTPPTSNLSSPSFSATRSPSSSQPAPTTPAVRNRGALSTITDRFGINVSRGMF